MLDRGLCLVGSVQGLARCNYWQRKYRLVLVQSHDGLTLVFKLYKKHTIAVRQFWERSFGISSFSQCDAKFERLRASDLWEKILKLCHIAYICYHMFLRDILTTTNFLGLVDR